MGYIKAIKNNFILSRTNMLLSVAITFCAFILGEIISGCIITFAKDVKDYASIGSVFAIMCGAIIVVVMASTGFITDFEYALKMGKTRKVSAISIFATSTLYGYIVLAQIIILTLLDKLVVNTFIKLPYDIDTMPVLLNPFVLLVPIIVVLVGGAIGLAFYKWGKPVFWVLWAIWMFGCLGVPRMANDIADKNTSTLIGKIANTAYDFFAVMPTTAYILLAGIILLVTIIFLVVNISKYSIKN